MNASSTIDWIIFQEDWNYHQHLHRHHHHRHHRHSEHLRQPHHWNHHRWLNYFLYAYKQSDRINKNYRSSLLLLMLIHYSDPNPLLKINLSIKNFLIENKKNILENKICSTEYFQVTLKMATPMEASQSCAQQNRSKNLELKFNLQSYDLWPDWQGTFLTCKSPISMIDTPIDNTDKAY